MKRIVIFCLAALFALPLFAQEPSVGQKNQVKKRLDAMETSIALTPEERAKLEPLMLQSAVDMSNLPEEQRKDVFAAFTKNAQAVVGQTRWAVAMGMEKGKPINVPIPMKQRAEMLAGAFSLDAAQTEKMAEIQTFHLYRMNDLNTAKASKDEITAQWNTYMDQMTELLGSRQKALQANKLVQESQKKK